MQPYKQVFWKREGDHTLAGSTSRSRGEPRGCILRVIGKGLKCKFLRTGDSTPLWGPQGTGQIHRQGGSWKFGQSRDSTQWSGNFRVALGRKGFHPRSGPRRPRCGSLVQGVRGRNKEAEGSGDSSLHPVKRADSCRFSDVLRGSSDQERARVSPQSKRHMGTSWVPTTWGSPAHLRSLFLGGGCSARQHTPHMKMWLWPIYCLDKRQLWEEIRAGNAPRQVRWPGLRGRRANPRLWNCQCRGKMQGEREPKPPLAASEVMWRNRVARVSRELTRGPTSPWGGGWSRPPAWTPHHLEEGRFTECRKASKGTGEAAAGGHPLQAQRTAGPPRWRQC